MPINPNTPSNNNYPQHKAPNDGTTKPPTPINKPILIENTSQPLSNVPWRAEALPSQRLLNAIGKPNFIL